MLYDMIYKCITKMYPLIILFIPCAPFFPPGGDDGPPSPDDLLHSRHWQHCGPDGPQEACWAQRTGHRHSKQLPWATEKMLHDLPCVQLG